MQQKLDCLRLPWPAPWAELFGRERPLIVEIGFGNGDYLIALAQAHPEHNIIGFEVAHQSMLKAEKKIQTRKLSNALAVYSPGETALHHLFTPGSVEQMHINYPDPWFKARHAGRRIMQRDTLDAIVSRLQPGGLFYLATDIVDYAEMSDELLRETPGLDNLLETPWTDHLPQRLIQTKYEQKGLREGRPGNYFCYRRNDAPAPHVPVMKELPVPHVILHTPLPPQQIAAAIQKEVFHRGQIHVALLNGFWNPSYDTVLLEIMIEEPTISQHIALTLAHREAAGEYTLKFATFGMPRPTEGMHFATSEIGKWLAGLHPDARIVADRTRYGSASSL